VGETNDQYELEADRVAETVVPQLQTIGDAGESNDDDNNGNDRLNQLQQKPLIGSLLQKLAIQRESAEEDEIMMQSEQGEIATASDAIESAINQKKGGGSALPDIFRSKVEQAIGADFSRVKIHTDQEADTLSRSLSARAFTIGNDIFFKQGEYNPSSTEGQKLITHELTHTIQQGASSSFGQMKPLDVVLNDNLVTQKQFSNSAGMLQRDGEDTLDTEDPLPTTKQDLQDDLGLYYGLERGYRGVTISRLKKRREAAGVDMNNTPLPTIDQYNKAVGNELPHRIGGWSFCLFLCPSCFIAPQDFEVVLRHPRLTRLVPNPDH
jgi:hypothetical protein